MLFNMKHYENNPLYITDFQRALKKLPENQQEKIILKLRLSAQGHFRLLEFQMPSGAALSENIKLCERYLLAMLNNFISSFGGEMLEIYYRTENKALDGICRRAEQEFNADCPINNRVSYGVYLNYINRMNPHLGLGRFKIARVDMSEWAEPCESLRAKIYEPGDSEAERALLRRAAMSLEGKRFCSLDIGGNSIKGAVVENGEITFIKEQRWYPTGCKTSEEILSPILLMLRFLHGCAALSGNCGNLIVSALETSLSIAELSDAVNEMEKIGGSKLKTPVFDAITIGFPDIVVHNKIAGGESFKQKGVKDSFGEHYDEEFAKTVNLDDMAEVFVKPGGTVVVLNDGNAASFITSVEQAFLEESIIDENGMFINTIGTEMGTGFISRAGTIQYFPLEGFQQVIDLGQTRFAQYPAEDIRSVNSMNTGIPGTVQKFVTQLGLFRMAVTGLMEQDPPAFQKLVNDGILQYDKELDHLIVAVEPKDRRGELTRALIDMLIDGHPVLVETFRSMGWAMGMLIDQGRLIFPEIPPIRLLSGGIIASDHVYNALAKSLSEYNPNYVLIRLDENIMSSPLLKKMQPHQRNFNVAIGSAYIGNFALIKKCMEAVDK